MTASFLPCLKSARLDLIGLLVCACLGWTVSAAARAEAPATEVSPLKFERVGDSVLLSATVKFDLSAAIEEALQKGVPVIFVAQVNVFQERWYWTNKRVLSAERHMRLVYQPLTRRWRLNAASGMITPAGLGVALNQNFETLPDALGAVQRLARWKIADIGELELDKNYYAEFRFQLDASQLPRLFQIGTLGQADWNIEALVKQPLTIEVVR